MNIPTRRTRRRNSILRSLCYLRKATPSLIVPEKLRLVYFPYLATGVLFFAGYSGLRYLLEVQSGILPLKQDVLNFWLPAILSFVCVFAFLRKRIRVLHLNTSGGRSPYAAYIFVAGVGICVPTIAMQEYIDTAAHGLAAVQHVSEIDPVYASRYYALEQFHVNKDDAAFYGTAVTSGKRNQNLTFTIYVAMPVYDSSDLQAPQPAHHWFGVKYSETISTPGTDEGEQSAYAAFYADVQRQFAAREIKNESYFENVPASDERDGYVNAIGAYSATAEEPFVILTARATPFEERSGATLEWSFGLFGAFALIFLVMVLIPKLNRNKVQRLMEGKTVRGDTDTDFFEKYLVPRGNHFMTSLLILVNLAVFVVMTLGGVHFMSPTADSLIGWGALSTDEMQAGQYWRLVTCIFMHSGIIHVVMNMLGLGIAGASLEPVLGRTKLLVTFLVTGIAAGFISYKFHEHVVEVGASGAIFGLYGTMIALLCTKVIHGTTRALTWILALAFMGLNFLLGFAIPGIDNMAHLGGLAAGFIFGILLSLLFRRDFQSKAKTQGGKED